MLKRDKKPNVLLVFSDQHNASVLGCENHPDVMTPNLDNLAKSGVRYTRAYSQNAICVPSRTSMFSGLYPRTVGCFDNDDRSDVMKEVISLQKTFKINGYRTGAFGKRHIYSAVDDGWDEKAGHQYYENPENNYIKWINELGYGEAFAKDWAAEFSAPPENSGIFKEFPFTLLATKTSDLPENMTMEAYTALRSKEFMEECTKLGQPFFCFASFYRPHQPYTPLLRYYQMYPHDEWGDGLRKNSTIKIPHTLRQNPQELPSLFQDQHNGKNRVWRLDKARVDEQLYRDYIASYYALVTEIDSHVGALIETVKELGIEEDTIIIYTSDHGDFVGAHGMVEKCAAGHNVYEETLRVPMIFSWKGGILENVTTNQLVELIDVYPTLMKLCGLNPHESMQKIQGISQADFLVGRKSNSRQYTVSENKIQITVVTDRYKLGIWKEEGYGVDLLFDRIKDSYEVVNLIDNPEYAEIKQQLKEYLDEWLSLVPKADESVCSTCERHTI